jgi:hypothetical protein
MSEFYRDEYGNIYAADEIPGDRPVWGLGRNDDGDADPEYEWGYFDPGMLPSEPGE